jgi:hypothetical protein
MPAGIGGVCSHHRLDRTAQKSGRAASVMAASALVITRIVNLCLLVEFGHHAVLTDPGFSERRYMRFGEPLGITVARLPIRRAILGSRALLNQWHVNAMGSLRVKDATRVLVPICQSRDSAPILGENKVEFL